jgi:hypothetical protein
MLTHVNPFQDLEARLQAMLKKDLCCRGGIVLFSEILQQLIGGLSMVIWSSQYFQAFNIFQPSKVQDFHCFL